MFETCTRCSGDDLSHKYQSMTGKCNSSLSLNTVTTLCDLTNSQVFSGTADVGGVIDET